MNNIINKTEKEETKNIKGIYNIPPEKYEQNILEEIRDILKKGKSLIVIEELFFINGLIRTKLGAVILDDNQENYFFEYFYLLTNAWSYIPKKFEIDCARIIIILNGLFFSRSKIIFFPLKTEINKLLQG